LVKHHLLMSITAQRRDISDPEVIKKFAGIVRDEAHLDHLYCLTVADMRATNESLWNSWKANLLEELYFNTKRAFLRGLEKPVDLRAKIRENQQQAIELLNVLSVDEEKLQVLWSNFKADYFLRYSPVQIAWHCRHILDHDTSKPLVLISPIPYRGGTEVFIYTKASANLFANTAALLNSKRLSIHDAKIITSKTGYAANTFVVLDQRGKTINDDARAAEIAQSLALKLDKPVSIVIKSQPISERLKQFKIPTQVSFIESNNKNRTLIEIVALDRPGLLSSFAQVLQSHKIQIHTAKITTFGEKAEDVFTVSNANGEALSEDQQSQLNEGLSGDLK
jgi:[protein-PII] uridylyltransferase